MSIPRDQVRAFVMGTVDGDVRLCDAVWAVLEGNETCGDAARSVDVPASTFKDLVSRVRAKVTAFVGNDNGKAIQPVRRSSVHKRRSRAGST